MDRNEKYWIKNTRERSTLSNLVFHTIRELKLAVKVFSILCYECYTRVEAFKNLQETMHVQVGHLSQVSTFDLFEFLSKFFFPISKLGVRRICECGLYTGVYSTSLRNVHRT